MNNRQTDNSNFSEEDKVNQEIESSKISVFQAPKMKKKRKNRSILSTLLTISAASIVGILFGIGILQLFIGLNDQSAMGEVMPEVTQPATAAKPSIETKAFQLPELSGYMIQAGVFTELENAEEWQFEFASSNLPTILWEKEEQYFLFLGIFETEEIARIKISEFDQESDLFIKQWETAAKEIQVTSEEEAWITQFQTIWSNGLMAKETAGLAELADTTPASDLLHDISNHLETKLQADDTDQLYLDLIYLYGQIGKDI